MINLKFGKLNGKRKTTYNWCELKEIKNYWNDYQKFTVIRNCGIALYQISFIVKKKIMYHKKQLLEMKWYTIKIIKPMKQLVTIG